MNEIVTTISRP